MTPVMILLELMLLRTTCPLLWLLLFLKNEKITKQEAWDYLYLLTLY